MSFLGTGRAGARRMRVPRTLAAAVLLAVLPGAGNAAPAPDALGPAVAVGTPAGGYVGELSLVPEHGPVGTRVRVDASGLPPGENFELVWRTVAGRWKVRGAEYRGRDYRPVAYRIATVRSDAAGKLSAKFTAPDDFGFQHDVVLQKGGRLYTQAGFAIDMTVEISPKRGPVGTPIAVEVKGIGWRYLENSWMLMYDNRLTGWMSSVTTRGTARFTLPAAGQPGRHMIEVQHGAFTFPYRNMQQSPRPDRPVFAVPFTITAGPAVLPPAPARQVQTAVRRLPKPGALRAARPFSVVGEKLAVSAAGLAPGKSYRLNWATVTGNRVAGQGWQEASSVIASATADAKGRASFAFKTPDDLGGAHRLWLEDGKTRLEGTHWIAPSAVAQTATRGPAGTKFTLHLKGVGWTETANIYTIVYDNAYIGYSCGFNSQGDVEIHLHATGAPGWHFIDLYPAIYKGKERRPRNFRLPQLTYADDHPGEDLPRFRFAFEVTPEPASTASR